MVFDELRSKGSLLELKANYFVMNNIYAIGMMSYESAILNMIVSNNNNFYPNINRNNKLGCLNKNGCDNSVVDIKNSNFTNIVTYTKSILFNINLENLAKN